MYVLMSAFVREEKDETETERARKKRKKEKKVDKLCKCSDFFKHYTIFHVREIRFKAMNILYVLVELN